MFIGLVLMHAKYFVRDGSAAEEEYYGVIWTLCWHLFIVGLEMVQVLQGYGIDQKSHPFSRAITFAIPEKHAWGLAQ